MVQTARRCGIVSFRQRTGAGDGATAAPAEAADIAPGDEVEFIATEFAFAPAELMATAGTYTGVLVNDGTIGHDIKFDDGDAIVAAAGETVEFDFEVPAEGIRYICSIPGHADAGMEGSSAPTPRRPKAPAEANAAAATNRHGRGRPRRTALRAARPEGTEAR